MDIDEWIMITDSNQVFVNKLEHFLHLKQTTNKHTNTKKQSLWWEGGGWKHREKTHKDRPHQESQDRYSPWTLRMGGPCDLGSTGSPGG